MDITKLKIGNWLEMKRLEIHVGNIATFLDFGYEGYGYGWGDDYGNGRGDGWGYYKTKDRQLVGNGNE